MKQIKFFAMAFAALAVFSCAKNKMGDGENPPVVEGVETYATFNFQVDGNAPKSRAASETDAGKTTAKDDVVKDIRIAVFKVGTPSLLEATATVKVTAPGLTNTAIKLTSGQKRIFVFANSETTVGFPTLTIGATTLETCYASLIDLDPTKASFSMADITSDAKGFFMSNARTAGSLKNLLPNITAAASQAGDETANHFTFTVQRAISKVNAKLTAGVATGVAGGTLSDLFYTVRNINKQFRPVQTFLDVNITDAEAAGKTILPIAAFYNKFDGVSDADMEKPATFTDYDRMADFDQPLTETKPTTAVFVTENTNARQVLGNTSYLAVKGKYTPTAVLASCAYENIGDGIFTPVVGTLEASGDFYKVDLAGLKKTGIGGKGLTNNLFTTQAGAKALLDLVLIANSFDPAAVAGSAEKTAYDAELAKRLLKYTAGATYYRLNIGITTPGTPAVTTFGIKRNSTYSIDITKINKLGTNDETKLDEIPETPVTSEETNVTATITIAPWNQMDQSGEL